MNYVLDSCALIAMLRKEPGGEIVAEMFDAKDNVCYVHAINLCEVFYEFKRNDSEDVAKSVIEDLLEAGLLIKEDLDMDFWQHAGRYKANLRRISLADCFCISLAKRLSGAVVTSDHHEFDAVVNKDLIKVEFIR
jgi:PIN domain nuclease of toxin-antitoxin system